MPLPAGEFLLFSRRARGGRGVKAAPRLRFFAQRHDLAARVSGQSARRYFRLPDITSAARERPPSSSLDPRVRAPRAATGPLSRSLLNLDSCVPTAAR